MERGDARVDRAGASTTPRFRRPRPARSARPSPAPYRARDAPPRPRVPPSRRRRTRRLLRGLPIPRPLLRLRLRRRFHLLPRGRTVGDSSPVADGDRPEHAVRFSVPPRRRLRPHVRRVRVPDGLRRRGVRRAGRVPVQQTRRILRRVVVRGRVRRDERAVFVRTRVQTPATPRRVVVPTGHVRVRGMDVDAEGGFRRELGRGRAASVSLGVRRGPAGEETRRRVRDCFGGG